MARVLHLISSNERRGAEVFACELADHLRGAGHDVRVLAVAPSNSTELLDAEVAGSGRTDPRGFLRILRAARAADMVVSFGSTSLITGALAARIAGRPFVYRNIGDPGVWGGARLSGLRIGAPVRSAATVVALYPGARDTLARRYHLRPDRIRTIPRGVPAERFPVIDEARRAAARERLGLLGDAAPGRWMAYIGALSPEKDPLAAVDVLGTLPDDVGLVMAGGGPLEAEVRRAADRFGRRARVLGSVGDVRDVLAAADLLVLTSHTEGIPGAVIEAGLSGLPAVATAVGGVPNVVDDRRSGRLVPPASQAELAAAVLDVLEHRDAYGAEAAVVCRDRYSMASVGRAWEEVVAELTTPPAPATAPVGRVLQVVATTRRRGAEVFAQMLGDHVQTQGWEQRTVAVAESEGALGLPFQVLGSARFRPMTLIRLARLARRSDVLIAHGSNSLLPTAVVATLCRRPYAYRNIGDPQHWGDVPFANLRIGFALRRAARVVALSRNAADWLVTAYGLDGDRVVQIPNAVAVDDLRVPTAADRAAARAPWGLGPDDEVLGYLGSLSPEKRPEWAVAAVAERPGATLIIGGEGPLRTDIEQRAASRAAGRVRFVGVLPTTRQFYDAIDLLLLPSITEGMPAVAIEAAVCGIPTVATDVGAVREVVGPGVGTVVPPTSEAAFVAAVAGADLTQRVPADARERLAADFDIERVGGLWLQLFADIRRPRRG